MPLEFTEKSARQMREIQQALSVELLKANANKVEAAIAAFACIRCARALLDQYPAATRAVLVDTATAFLEHRDAPNRFLVES